MKKARLNRKRGPKSKISAYLVVYNEEDNIKEALESLDGVADEIIIVHDGECSDKTLEISRKFTNKIFVRKSLKNAEPHRPFAIKNCSYDWVLQIDADERVSAEMKRNIKKIIKKRNTDAFVFNWVVKTRGIKINFKKKILFRKNKMYSIGIPHFETETYGKEEYVNLDLIHDTKEFSNIFSLAKSIFIKNKKRSKVAADLIAGDKIIETFNCSLGDSNNRQIKKINLIKKRPLFSMFALSFFSLFCSLRNNWGGGVHAFLWSLHVPVFYFLTAYNVIKKNLSYF